MSLLACTKKYEVSCPKATIPKEYKKTSAEILPPLAYPLHSDETKDHYVCSAVSDFQSLMNGFNECEHIRLKLLKTLEVYE